jgi:hypothetical protein
VSFRVGQKVVCVDAKTPAFTAWDDAGREALTEGVIYTVSATRIWKHGEQSIQCNELPTTSVLGGERWYQAKRFRPLVERKTSIEIFQQIRRDVESGAKIEERA